MELDSYKIKKYMNTGILYNIWWHKNPDDCDFIDELNYSLECSKKQNLPIKILFDKTSTIDINKINLSNDNFIYYELTSEEKSYNVWYRKLKMIDISPFEKTLFLDTDAFILEDTKFYNIECFPTEQNIDIDINYVFDKLDHYGMAMAFDGHVMGQREYRIENNKRYSIDILPEYKTIALKYLKYSCTPLYNWGVVFFNKCDKRIKDLFDLSKDILIKENCTEQIAMSIAIDILNFNIFTLHHVTWNHRSHSGPYVYLGTKIIHNPHWFKIIKQ